MEVDSGDSGWKRVVAVLRCRTLLNGQRIRVLCLGLNLPHGIVEQKGKFCIGKRNYRQYTKYAQHPKYTKKVSGTSGEYYFPAPFSINFLIIGAVQWKPCWRTDCRLVQLPSLCTYTIFPFSAITADLHDVHPLLPSSLVPL